MRYRFKCQVSADNRPKEKARDSFHYAINPNRRFDSIPNPTYHSKRDYSIQCQTSGNSHVVPICGSELMFL